MPSGSASTLPGILNITQCTEVPCGASGSSTSSAKLFVLFGALCHTNGGETLPPFCEYLSEIGAPFLNAGLVSVNTLSASAASNKIPTPARQRTTHSIRTYFIGAALLYTVIVPARRGRYVRHVRHGRLVQPA